eukprot:XP_028351014.1 MAP/microtubule affinity-regulating kinase 3-like [Physeter catodon]
MKALNHPNIVKLLEMTDTEETLFLVMEDLSWGDMSSHLEDHGHMTEAEAQGPFQQLVSALQHCHPRGIMHQDLKPGNLLFDADMNVKITDFGLSNECDESGKLDTFCGSPTYAALELFLGQSYDSPVVDMWMRQLRWDDRASGTGASWTSSGLSASRPSVMDSNFRLPLCCGPVLQPLSLILSRTVVLEGTFLVVPLGPAAPRTTAV